MDVFAPIRRQLLGVIVVPIIAIIGFFSMYYPRQQLRTLREDLRVKARAYGVVMSRQVRSAVAFDDRETAREVLGSLASDPEVASVVLYGGPGPALYLQGNPSPWVARTRSTHGDVMVYPLAQRMAVVAPVTSLEGPKGTLVIELSTDRIRNRRHDITTSAVLGGALALAFGVFTAWLIARAQAEQFRMRETVRAQLSDANAQLRREMENRARIEVELRQAHKLESVGRLASGIAHEINTPVQYVSDSCHFLRDATSDVERLLATYQTLLREIHDGVRSPADALRAAAEAEQTADLAYLQAETPLAAERALEGLDRVATIVRAMKEFAYPERKEQTLVDVNRAIATTLMVAHNEYKYVADVRTEYGDLPQIRCHLGELNQTVLNLVVNAAHAIEAAVAGTDRRGVITIKTSRQDDFVTIEVTDTGTGIAPEILDKIFDPFFTTKEFGKGTGQGLALARAVAEKHGGRLAVTSEVGKGSTFRLVLHTAGAVRPRTGSHLRYEAPRAASATGAPQPA